LGISLEIVGFVLVIKSTIRLDYKPGGFMGGEYVDPKTEKPPPHIESSPIPLIYRPGIYLVIAGLALQIADVIVSEYFKIDI
jgi:hypothetical protein